MKALVRTLAVCTLVALGVVICTGASAAAAAPGQQAFLDLKCNNCHAVSSASIEAKMKGPNAGPDLAGIGAKKDAAFLKDYIQGNKDLDGKKHKSAFKGTPQQLDDVVAWLASLK